MTRRKPVKKSRSLGRAISCILFLCFMTAAIYFLFFSPFFQIKEIIISKSDFSAVAEKIIQDNLREKKFGLFPRRNFFFISLEKIKADIAELSPEIKSVIVNKKMPDKLEANIAKRQDIGVWCQVEDKVIADQAAEGEKAAILPMIKREIKKCFRIDQEGIIYKDSPIISGSLILNIYDGRKTETEPRIKDNVLSASTTNSIIQIKNILADKLKINADNFEIISSEDFLVKTGEGWNIYFSSAYSAESQIEALKIILKELVKEARQSLEYVDLRIEGRAYYR